MRIHARQQCAVVYSKALGSSLEEIGRMTCLGQPRVKRYIEMYGENGLKKLIELSCSVPASELVAVLRMEVPSLLP
jgi:hypothetical protein